MTDDPQDDGLAGAYALSPLELSYLTMMYDEHARQARIQEALRGAVTSLFMALIAAALVFWALEKTDAWHTFIEGAYVCLLSLMGAFLNLKHFERYKLHHELLCGFRKKIERNVRRDLTKLEGVWRRRHNKQFPIISRIKIYIAWTAVYGVTFLMGASLCVVKLHDILPMRHHTAPAAPSVPHP